MTVAHGHEKSEHGLRQALSRHEAILASALDPVVTIDADGIVQDASRSVQRVFGWSPDELIGRNVHVLMPEPHRAAHDGFLAEYRSSGTTSIIGRPRELEAVRRDGTLLPVEITVWKVDDPQSDQPLFTGILRDITSRKRVEDELARHRDQLEDLVAERTAELEGTHEQLRLADRLAAIGTLAAGLGHDMNNVLLPVRCRLDAIQAADLPAQTIEHIDAVRKSAEYLQQLADGLRLLSLDPEDAVASGEGTDIPTWWEQIDPLLARGLPKHVRFATSMPSDLPTVAVAPHRLSQAMLNLVVNAGEALADEGKVRVWAERADDGLSVRIGVTDNGHGMTPDVRRRAFDPFFTTKYRGLGTGLGLSLVQGVALSAGGTVDIASEPGKGTTVVLTLPIQIRTAARVKEPGTVAVVSIAAQRTASLMAALLKAAGFSVIDGGDPCAGALWVTDPTPDTLNEARRYLAEAQRQVLVVGTADAQWAKLGAILIDDPSDFEQLRERISDAASLLIGADR